MTPMSPTSSDTTVFGTIVAIFDVADAAGAPAKEIHVYVPNNGTVAHLVPASAVVSKGQSVPVVAGLPVVENATSQVLPIVPSQAEVPAVDASTAEIGGAALA